MKKLSGILEQVVKIKKVKKMEATHFALCNGDKIRYLICLNREGKQRLSNNLSTYSGKLGLLMKVLPIIPFSMLSILKMGYFVEAKLEDEVDDVVSKTKTQRWNMIIGTYGPQQKLVLQCFISGEPAVFIKIGNEKTFDEMKNETNFLSGRHIYKSFTIPELVPIEIRENKLIYQATKEFIGKKVDPILTEDIVHVYKEIAATQSGVETEFSHGDFAPWNIKKTEDGYVVFDWEFCGMRMKGFDLMHYVVSIKMRLENKSLDDAFEEGLICINKYYDEFHIDKSSFLKEYLLLRG